MSITIITTTRDRPEAFALLERWLNHQSWKPDQWLIVNDSDRPERYAYNCGQEVIVRQPGGDRHSLCENWLVALPAITGKRILVWEDDDWYGVNYVARLHALLDGHHLAGVRQDLYYHLPTRRFKRMHNVEHCSLACTGFDRYMLSHMRRLAKAGDPMFDMALWRVNVSKQTIPNEDGRRPLHVGLKGSRTRGIGTGHNPNGWSTDGALAILGKWLGPDVAPYRAIAAGKPW